MEDIGATPTKDGSVTKASTGVNQHCRNIERW
jgi:hypothetical protein